MAGLAVIWEGGQVFPKAPSLGRSVQCSLMGENKGHIPAWGPHSGDPPSHGPPSHGPPSAQHCQRQFRIHLQSFQV